MKKMNDYWSFEETRFKALYKKYKLKFYELSDYVYNLIKRYYPIEYNQLLSNISIPEVIELQAKINYISNNKYSKYLNDDIKKYLKRKNIKLQDKISINLKIEILKLFTNLFNDAQDDLYQIIIKKTKEDRELYDLNATYNSAIIGKEEEKPLFVLGVPLIIYILDMIDYATITNIKTVYRYIIYNDVKTKKDISKQNINILHNLIRPPNKQYYLGSLVDINNEILSKVIISNYKKNNIKMLQHISIVDDKTSNICLDRNLKIFPIEQAKIGVNVPPLHRNCRSYIIPYLNKNK